MSTGIVTIEPREAARDARRERSETSNREKREPFADQLTKPEKRIAGRTVASQVPANIRVSEVDLDDDDLDYIRQRLGMKLGKFASSIERVTVRVKDINGDRGGIDKVCNIKVVVSGLPSVVVEGRSDSIRAAVNSALAAVERAVRRVVQRRRMTSLRTTG
jgi:ribosome-associated translation inhibitor RaiA